MYKFCCNCFNNRSQGYDIIQDSNLIKIGLNETEKKDYRLTSLIANWEIYLEKQKVSKIDLLHFPNLFKDLLRTKNFRIFFKKSKKFKISYFILF